MPANVSVTLLPVELMLFTKLNALVTVIVLLAVNGVGVVESATV